MSIHWPIIRSLISAPRRAAIVDDTRTYTRGEVLVGAMHVAAHLAGKSQTRTIGLLLPTSGAFPIAALASWMLGKVIVPINYLLKPEEMSYVIRDCGCDCVVTVQAMLDHLGPAVGECLGGSAEGRVQSAEGGERSKLEVQGSNQSQEGPHSASSASHTAPAGASRCVKHVVRLEDVGFKGIPDINWPKRASDDELGVLLYTSGTSGKPKGVMLTHGNITANMMQVQEWVHFDAKTDVMFGVLPQFHTFGLTVLTLLPLAAGMKVVYTARFVPGRIVKLIREHRPTVMVAIPSMYNALLHAKDVKPEDFASLRYVVSGGEPLPAAVFDAFRDKLGVTINEGYGLTETSPVTNWCRPREWRRGTVGKPLPWIDQRIVAMSDVGFGMSDAGRERASRASAHPTSDIAHPTWHEVPTGQEGEIRMRGPNVMRGYYHLPEETAKAFDERGYFRTGDIGRFDEDGFLYITGRLKEMLIIGGENVFPREIEEVLNAHPAVKDSGVVGKKDPMRGELPVAFVELKDGANGGPGASPGGVPSDMPKTLIQWCRTKLAGYKVPDEVRVVEALPRNATGKVVRRELKKLVENGGGAA